LIGKKGDVLTHVLLFTLIGNLMVDVIEFGDCRDIMRNWIELGVKVHTCVTSPPYFGLRDYKCDGQIGLEKTPDEYIATLVDVFRHVRELLVDDGTLWVNIGDTYATNGGGDQQARRAPGGIKPKDLIGIPWMLAFALRADGWYLRQDIIWHKPNPMPESVRDRCTKAHEYVFLLSKGPRYFFDSDAIKEPSAGWPVGGAKTRGKTGYASASGAGKSPQRDSYGGLGGDGETRNRRSVWTVATRPYKGAHFAKMHGRIRSGARRMARCWIRSAGQALRPWWHWRKAERLCCAS
jgi:hypothetical protein